MSKREFKAKNSQMLVNAEALFMQVLTSERGMAMAELQARSSLTRSTTHRLLSDFVMAGWVEYHPIDERNSLWCVTKQFVGVAFEWKRQALKGQGLRSEWMLNDNQPPEDRDSVLKAITLFHMVANSDVNGLTLDQLQHRSGYPRTTTYRLLCTWEHLGWLRTVAMDNRSERWRLSTKMVEIAHQYENQRRRLVAKLHEEYEEVTGESL